MTTPEITAMPNCRTAFHTVLPEQVESLLSALTQDHFVGGRAAYQLDDGSYSIDAGENDIRAIYDENAAAITFFCRYQRDMALYDKKLQSFAAKHGLHSTTI